MLVIMLVAPVTTGMLIRAKRPETADKIRPWSRRLAGGAFAVVVAILLVGNVKVLGAFAKTALPPVLLTFAIAVAWGWGLARVSGLVAADRRAVTLEVAFQNVALAVGMAVVFFSRARGVGDHHDPVGRRPPHVWLCHRGDPEDDRKHERGLGAP
jgi:BASS family bile acid:Na+ symporter